MVRNGSESSKDLRERRKPQARRPRTPAASDPEKHRSVSECVDGAMSRDFRASPSVQLPLFGKAILYGCQNENHSCFTLGFSGSTLVC